MKARPTCIHSEFHRGQQEAASTRLGSKRCLPPPSQSTRVIHFPSELSLRELCYHCFPHDSVGLTSNTGGGILPGSAPLDYLPGDQARDSEREFAYPPD